MTPFVLKRKKKFGFVYSTSDLVCVPVFLFFQVTAYQLQGKGKTTFLSGLDSCKEGNVRGSSGLETIGNRMFSREGTGKVG